jgi:hypothetical protein
MAPLEEPTAEEEPIMRYFHVGLYVYSQAAGSTTASPYHGPCSTEAKAEEYAAWLQEAEANKEASQAPSMWYTEHKKDGTWRRLATWGNVDNAIDSASFLADLCKVATRVVNESGCQVWPTVDGCRGAGCRGAWSDS